VQQVLDWCAHNLPTLAAIALAVYVLARSRTPALLKDELAVTRERCTRFESENGQLKAVSHTQEVTIAELKARTDLDAVRNQLSEAHADVAKQISEGNLLIIGAIQAVSKDIMTGFIQHNEEDRQFQQGVTNSLSRVSSILDQLEKRVPTPRG
jgi:hypothetical protein